jgi:hypothetical protein
VSVTVSITVYVAPADAGNGPIWPPYWPPEPDSWFDPLPMRPLHVTTTEEMLPSRSNTDAEASGDRSPHDARVVGATVKLRICGGDGVVAIVVVDVVVGGIVVVWGSVVVGAGDVDRGVVPKVGGGVTMTDGGGAAVGGAAC